MSSIGAPELIIILIVVLLLFGTTRLPKLARSLGQASKEFKEGVAERENEEQQAAQASQTAQATPPPVAPTVDAPPPSATPAADAGDQVTMSRADLEALLDERDRRAGKDVPPPAQG